MKSSKVFVVALLLGSFVIWQPPKESVSANDGPTELLERQVGELREQIERAVDSGREELALDLRRKLEALVGELKERRFDVEHEEREHRQREFQMHLREFEARRHMIEFELAELDLRRQRIELLSNPLATSLEAIETASHHMEPEEAAEFFSQLLEETELFPVKQRLRQRLVELNFELHRRNAALEHLRRLIDPELPHEDAETP